MDISKCTTYYYYITNEIYTNIRTMSPRTLLTYSPVECRVSRSARTEGVCPSRLRIAAVPMSRSRHAMSTCRHQEEGGEGVGCNRYVIEYTRVFYLWVRAIAVGMCIYNSCILILKGFASTIVISCIHNVKNVAVSHHCNAEVIPKNILE